MKDRSYHIKILESTLSIIEKFLLLKEERVDKDSIGNIIEIKVKRLMHKR
jgi:hypothetical protein